MKLTLNRKEPLAGDVISFVFDPPESLGWKPGQYMKYTLPHDNPDDRGTERWFTIAAPPSEGQPRISTRIIDGRRSTFKEALRNLNPGDQLEVEAPEGDFTIDDLEARYVLIAGGIGSTPYHAMLTELDHDGTMPNIHLLYGAATDQPLYREEFDRLAGKYPQLKVDYIVEPERINQDIIKRYVSDLKTPLFYVSGPEPMVEAFCPMLQTAGVPEDHIKRDDFPGYDW